MRILLVKPWDRAVGGVTTVVDRLAQHLEQHRHHVLLLHRGESTFLRWRRTGRDFNGCELNLRNPLIAERPFRSIAAFTALLPVTLAQLIRLIKVQRIDVVNIHYPLPAFYPLAMCRRLLPTRLVTSVHGSDIFPDARAPTRSPRAVRALLQASDRIVAPSQGFLDAFLGLFPQLTDRSIVIENGVDLGEIDRSDDRLALCQHLMSPPYILTISSLKRAKGVDVLLAGFAASTGRARQAALVIVGDGPLGPDLQRRASELGVADRVRFVGEQPRRVVICLLRHCEAFVLASRSESFGIAAAEAMACAKPVIATRVGGLQNLIEHERTGLLVPPEDPPAIGAAITNLMNDLSLQHTLAAAGRQAVCDRWTVDATGQAYQGLFQQLLS